jgi:ATP-dependent DNA helicase Q1
MEHNSSLTGSGEASSSSKKTVDQPSLVREHALKKQIAAVRNEIAEYDVELRKMQELRTLRAQDERDLLTQLHALQHGRRAGTSDTTGTGKAAGEIDYSVDWDWSKQMQVKMKNIFGINGFRLCQKR